MAITALPPVPQRTDTPDVFVTKTDAFIAALPLFQTEANALQTDVNAKQVAAASSASASAASAVASAASAVDAQTAATNAAATAGVVKWVSGTTYANGATVWSPANNYVYRRKTSSGSGTTDPSADTTNYALISTALPDQTAQDGKVLKTTAGVASWAFTPNMIGQIVQLPVSQASATYTSPSGDIYLKTGTIVSRAAAVSASYDVTNLELIGSTSPYPQGVLVGAGAAGGSIIHGLAYGNGKFVCGGTTLASVPLRYSSDGVTWTPNASSITVDIQDVQYINSKFVAVSSNATYSSTDGITWTTNTSVVNNTKFGLGFVGSNYMCSTAQGTYYSPDLSTWTTSNLWSVHQSSGAYLNNVLYVSDVQLKGIWAIDPANHVPKLVLSASGKSFTILNKGGTLYAVATNGAATWATSTDGVNWTSGTSGSIIAGFTTTNYGATNIATDGTTIVTNAGTGFIQYSTNGTSWTSASTATGLHNISYVGSNFFNHGPSSGAVWKSANGTSGWAAVANLAGVYVLSMAYGASVYVAAGSDGAGNIYIYSSADGATWTSRTAQLTGSGTTGLLTNVVFANSQFVVTCSDGRIWTSTNGTTSWTLRQTLASTAALGNGLFYVNSVWITTGPGGSATASPYAYSSDNGVTWTIPTVTAQSTSTTMFGYVWYVNSKYNMRGTNCFLNSASLASGNSIPTNINLSLNTTGYQSRFAFNGTYMISCGTTTTTCSAILVSSEGVQWSPLANIPSPLSTSTVFNDVVYANSLFVACPNNTYIMTSPEGMNWTVVNLSSYGIGNTMSAAWNGTLWWITGSNANYALTTTDFVTFTLRYVGGQICNRIVWGSTPATFVGVAMATGGVTTTPTGYTGAIGIPISVSTTGVTNYVKVK